MIFIYAPSAFECAFCPASNVGKDDIKERKLLRLFSPRCCGFVGDRNSHKARGTNASDLWSLIWRSKQWHSKWSGRCGKSRDSHLRVFGFIADCCCLNMRGWVSDVTLIRWVTRRFCENLHKSHYQAMAEFLKEIWIFCDIYGVWRCFTLLLPCWHWHWVKTLFNYASLMSIGLTNVSMRNLKNFRLRIWKSCHMRIIFFVSAQSVFQNLSIK